jgi:hypothetical protein
VGAKVVRAIGRKPPSPSRMERQARKMEERQTRTSYFIEIETSEEIGNA